MNDEVGELVALMFADDEVGELVALMVADDEVGELVVLMVADDEGLRMKWVIFKTKLTVYINTFL